MLPLRHKAVLDRIAALPGRACPWWMGFLLASPLRCLVHSPAKILGPHLRTGMVVLESGPAMGFFTLELARRVGTHGRVVAVDVEPRMLAGLRKRAAKAGLLELIETRLGRDGAMGVRDLAGTVDFVLAFAVVHEMSSASRFFADAFEALKPGGSLLLAEPSPRVHTACFEEELAAACQAGFRLSDRPAIPLCRAALFLKD